MSTNPLEPISLNTLQNSNKPIPRDQKGLLDLKSFKLQHPFFQDKEGSIKVSSSGSRVPSSKAPSWQPSRLKSETSETESNAVSSTQSHKVKTVDPLTRIDLFNRPLTKPPVQPLSSTQNTLIFPGERQFGKPVSAVTSPRPGILVSDLQKRVSQLNIRIRELNSELQRRTDSQTALLKQLQTNKQTALQQEKLISTLQEAAKQREAAPWNTTNIRNNSAQLKDPKELAIVHSIHQTEVRMFNNEIDKLNDIILAKNQEIFQLRKGQLEADKNSQSQLNLDLARLELQKLNGFIIQKNEDLAKTRLVIEEKDYTIAKLNATINQLKENQSKAERTKDELSHLLNQVSTLQFKLKQKQLELVTLSESKAHAEGQINCLKQLNQRKPISVAVPNHLEQKLVKEAAEKQTKAEIELYKVVSQLRCEMSETKHELTQQSQLLKTRDGELITLNKELSEARDTLIKIKSESDHKLFCSQKENTLFKKQLAQTEHRLQLKASELESAGHALSSNSQLIHSLKEQVKRLMELSNELSIQIHRMEANNENIWQENTQDLSNVVKKSTSSNINNNDRSSLTSHANTLKQKLQDIATFKTHTPAETNNNSLKLHLLKGSYLSTLKNHLLTQHTVRSSEEPVPVHKPVVLRAHKSKASSLEERIARFQTLESETGAYTSNIANLNYNQNVPHTNMDISRKTRLLFNTQNSSVMMDDTSREGAMPTNSVEVQCSLVEYPGFSEQLIQKDQELVRCEKELESVLSENEELRGRLERAIMIEQQQQTSFRSSTSIAKEEFFKQVVEELETRLQQMSNSSRLQKTAIAKLEAQMHQLRRDHRGQVSKLEAQVARLKEVCSHKQEEIERGQALLAEFTRSEQQTLKQVRKSDLGEDVLNKIFGVPQGKPPVTPFLL